MDKPELLDYWMKAAKLESLRNSTWISIVLHEPTDIEMVKQAAANNGLELLRIKGKDNHYLVAVKDSIEKVE